MGMKPAIVFLRWANPRRWRARVLGLGAVLILAAPAAAEVPSVVVSIKPLHSLVAAVMEGVGTPDLIVGGNVSLYDYSLKPEDSDRIAKARLIFWVGPMLETFLEKPLVERTPSAEVVRLADAPGVRLLNARRGGGWGSDADEQDMSPTGLATDGHFWLDPLNARRVVAAAATHLAAADPENAARYTRNAAELYRRLDALDAGLRPKVAPLAGKPFVVYRDSYQYFERRYGLQAVGAILAGPGKPLSPARLQEVRQRIRVYNARCVFGEPQTPAALLKSVVTGSAARTGILDPEGLVLEPGPDLYFTLITTMADAMGKCLIGRD